jgi:hypothetical protein
MGLLNAVGIPATELNAVLTDLKEITAIVKPFFEKKDGQGAEIINGLETTAKSYLYHWFWRGHRWDYRMDNVGNDRNGCFDPSRSINRRGNQ